MAIVMTLAGSQITPVTGYDYIAELTYGDDSIWWGSPELNAGTADYRTTGETQWDGYPDDGLETGWLHADLHVRGGAGGITWLNTNSEGAVAFDVSSAVRVDRVHLRAAVQAPALMLWRNTQVLFYRGNTLQERVLLAGFGVDRFGSGGTAEAMTTVQPARSDNDHVVVATDFRMAAPAGVWLDSYDVFSQIMINGSVGAEGTSGTQSSGLLRTSSTSLDMAVFGAAEPTKYSGEAFATAPLRTSGEVLDIEEEPELLGGSDLL